MVEAEAALMVVALIAEFWNDRGQCDRGPDDRGPDDRGFNDRGLSERAGADGP